MKLYRKFPKKVETLLNPYEGLKHTRGESYVNQDGFNVETLLNPYEGLKPR